MEIDLKSMSAKQLEKHLKDVKKALANVQARDRREAKKAAEKAAAEFGFTLSDLSEGAAAPKKPRKTRAKAAGPKSKPKFANPENPKQTWTGKGRQPNWYRAQIEKGKTPESMAI
ncbi:H-NS family nucleoid-associated regulatory protein [Marimonas sp. MJW-29]|uniref:H-NS family nucleoid-associated regulatory protein n=1 Tax=Sulfitobacter sediminis TaxID=3234186 RepID=A0ABV3RSJ9_9RHOB